MLLQYCHAADASKLVQLLPLLLRLTDCLLAAQAQGFIRRSPLTGKDRPKNKRGVNSRAADPNKLELLASTAEKLQARMRCLFVQQACSPEVCCK